MEEVAKAVEAIESEAVRLRERDHQAAVDEELRRHIISSVVKAMSELGFVVGKPKLLRESGNVAVVGTLSSGRTIRFDVRATGEMEFDMDGFKDRTCSAYLCAIAGPRVYLRPPQVPRALGEPDCKLRKTRPVEAIPRRE